MPSVDNTEKIAQPVASAPAAATVATPKPAAPAPAVIRRGRGAFTTGLRSEMPPPTTASSPAPTASAAAATPAATKAAPLPSATGIFNRVSQAEEQEGKEEKKLAALQPFFPSGANPHPNLNKNKMNRPSATFPREESEEAIGGGGGGDGGNTDGDAPATTTSAATSSVSGKKGGRNGGASDTVREQLFRGERRKRSIVIVGNTYALNKFSMVRLSNYSEKKPARLENNFLKGVHVSIALRRLAEGGGAAAAATTAVSGEGEGEKNVVKTIGDLAEGEEPSRVVAGNENDENGGEGGKAKDKADDANDYYYDGEYDDEDLSPEEREQRLWERQERQDEERQRRQNDEQLRRMAEAFNDGELHPLVIVSDGGSGGDAGVANNDHQYSYTRGGGNRTATDDGRQIDPLLVSPVLTCTKFDSLKRFFLKTFHDLWCLDDNKMQKVSIKLEFGKAFYTRSSRASSHSKNDFQQKNRMPFSSFVEGLNAETSQLFFINDAPLTVARGLDAIGDAKEKANYTLVKIFFFSKERQSYIVVRAIWDQQFNCFELTDIEHIGITFSWLILNLDNVPQDEQMRSAHVGGGEGVFSRHALPVEVQFRAFQRKKTIVGHPLEKKAKFILRKLTAVELDRLNHGYGSYDAVDFHAIARDDDEAKKNNKNGMESPEESSHSHATSAGPSSPNRPNNQNISGLFGGDLLNNNGITADTVPRLARKSKALREAEAKKKAEAAAAEEVVEINDDEYEVTSINIEHIETRRTRSGILLDSAHGLLIEHFEDHLARQKKEKEKEQRNNNNNNNNNYYYYNNTTATNSNEGEEEKEKLNAGLTFLSYRSCNIHWKMDPTKTPFENMEPALSDAFEVCERVLNRANTFEHQEYVSSKRSGGKNRGGGARGGFADDDDDNRAGHSAGVAGIDMLDDDDDYQYNNNNSGRGRGGRGGGGYHNNNNNNARRFHDDDDYDGFNNSKFGRGRAGGAFVRGGGGGVGSRKGGGISAIDGNEHRNDNRRQHNNTVHMHNNSGHYSRGGGGGGRFGGEGHQERGRGGGGGHYHHHNGGGNNNDEEEIWDMPASHYTGAVPPPLANFYGVNE